MRNETQVESWITRTRLVIFIISSVTKTSRQKIKTVTLFYIFSRSLILQLVLLVTFWVQILLSNELVFFFVDWTKYLILSLLQFELLYCTILHYGLVSTRVSLNHGEHEACLPIANKNLYIFQKPLSQNGLICLLLMK